MSIVIADAKLVAVLLKTHGEVEFQTPDGRPLGVFKRAPLERRFPEMGITEEELQRREADLSGKWYTAAEVEAKMREWRCSQ